MLPGFLHTLIPFHLQCPHRIPIPQPANLHHQAPRLAACDLAGIRAKPELTCKQASLETGQADSEEKH